MFIAAAVIFTSWFYSLLSQCCIHALCKFNCYLIICACAVLKANTETGPTKTGPAGPLATAMQKSSLTRECRNHHYNAATRQNHNFSFSFLISSQANRQWRRRRGGRGAIAPPLSKQRGHSPPHSSNSVTSRLL